MPYLEPLPVDEFLQRAVVGSDEYLCVGERERRGRRRCVRGEGRELRERSKEEEREEEEGLHNG